MFSLITKGNFEHLNVCSRNKTGNVRITQREGALSCNHCYRGKAIVLILNIASECLYSCLRYLARRVHAPYYIIICIICFHIISLLQESLSKPNANLRNVINDRDSLLFKALMSLGKRKLNYTYKNLSTSSEILHSFGC